MNFLSNRSMFPAVGIAILLGWSLSMPAEGWAKERVVVIGSTSPISHVNPAIALQGDYMFFFRNIFQGLTRYKFNSTELEGDLAKSWTVSKDGLVYTFKLRDNIQWHKGFGKVTAHDVKFSFDWLMDPKTRSIYMGELVEEIKEVKVVDDFTVEIHVKRPTAVFPIRCIRPKAAIVCKKAMEKYGKDFARNPIGSGPFIFESMSREQVILTANKDYYEGSPKIDKVIYKMVPDGDTLNMALEKGDVDFVYNLSREKAILDRLKAAGCKITVIDIGFAHTVFLNPKFKPFADIRVRKGIAHAIDKEAIIKHVLGGFGEKLGSPVPKGYFGHTEEGLQRYDFDLKKAKALLSEAGYATGFEVPIDTVNHPSHLPVALALQDQLDKVGIKLKLQVSDLPTFNKKVTSDASLMLSWLGARSPDADFYLTNFYHSAGFSPGYNLTRYNKLDKEIDEARSEGIPSKRQKIYHDIQKKLMEDLPGIPLFSLYVVTGYRSHVAGIPNKDVMAGIDFHALTFSAEK